MDKKATVRHYLIISPEIWGAAAAAAETRECSSHATLEAVYISLELCPCVTVEEKLSFT